MAFQPLASDRKLEAPRSAQAACPARSLRLSHTPIMLLQAWAAVRGSLRGCCRFKSWPSFLESKGCSPTEPSSQPISQTKDESQLFLLIEICGLTKMRIYIFVLTAPPHDCPLPPSVGSKQPGCLLLLPPRLPCHSWLYPLKLWANLNPSSVILLFLGLSGHWREKSM